MLGLNRPDAGCQARAELNTARMQQVMSCGVAVLRATPRPYILVLKTYRNLDLPKGVLEAGEDPLAGALRELGEETGIPPDAVAVDAGFRASVTYPSRFAGHPVAKTVIIFLARLLHEVPIVLTEHHGYEWLALDDDEAIRGSLVTAVTRELRAYLAASR